MVFPIMFTITCFLHFTIHTLTHDTHWFSALVGYSQMPPKRASAPKRKASSSDDEGEASQAQTKKSKLSSASPLPKNAQPTNKVLPVHISFPPRIHDTFRLATWNVCGLAASQKKVCQVGPAIYSFSVVSGFQTLRGG
jgi:hypothetical protein